MKLTILFACILYSLSAFSQTKETTYPCQCSYSYKIKYRKAAEENKIAGLVIIEMDINDSCLLSNPKILKGIGYGCDEEALRIANQIIISKNKCAIKCKEAGCTKGKIKQEINFKRPDDWY